MPVAIVGGAGKMGLWLARALVAENQQVVLIDRDEARLKEAASRLEVETTSDLRAICGADAFVLALPIDSFEEVVRELAPFTNAGQIALDITSVKAMPVAVMHRYLKQCLVLGAHPVWGPGAEGVRGQNVVLTPTNPAEIALAARLGQLLEWRGAVVSVMTPERHDRLMAAVLGLAHYIAIVAGDTLLSLDNLDELTRVSGPSFRALLSFVTGVLHEDPALYAAIQMKLPALPALEKAFTDKAVQWAETVKNRDTSAFVERMSALRSLLEEQQKKK